MSRRTVVTKKSTKKPTPARAVRRVTADQVLGDLLAKALKSKRYVVVVAHVDDGQLHRSQTSQNFPLTDLPAVFDFVTEELSRGAQVK